LRNISTMSSVVHVQNISAQTSEKEVRDFFSFCGKITNLSVTPSGDASGTQTATVTFEKDTAAKTALLLDNTQLGASQVHVTAGQSIGDVAASAGQTGAAHEGDEISQDDKPRARVVAEYLAHGYVLSDTAIQKALEIDNKHGVSNRFTTALQAFDSKFKATERAKTFDTQFGVSGHAQTGFNTLHSYFEKAIGTPTGQKLAAFYQEGEKQVRDVHAEARRLADLKGSKSGNVPQQVPGTEKTTCQCGGDSGTCPCAEGQCNCAGCSKAQAPAAGAGAGAPAAAPGAEGAPQTTGNS